MNENTNNQKRIKIDYGKLKDRLKEEGFLYEEIDHIIDAVKKSSKRLIKSINSIGNWGGIHWGVGIESFLNFYFLVSIWRFKSFNMTKCRKGIEMFYEKLREELNIVGIEGEKLEKIVSIVKECEIK